MESNGRSGSRPGNIDYNGSIAQKKGGTGIMRARPLTVNEALPYSPLSSVIPFNSDILPSPTIGLRSSVPLFHTEDDISHAREGIEALSKDAQGPSGTSQRLEKTLRELQRLLQPDKLLDYKFKVDFSQSQPVISASEQKPYTMSLSPFAQKIFDTTDVAYTPLTPETPGRQPNSNGIHPPPKQKTPPKAKPKATPKETRILPPTVSKDGRIAPAGNHISRAPVVEKNATHNNAAIKRNSTIEVEKQAVPQAFAPLSNHYAPEQGQNIKIILPNASDIINKDDYMDSSSVKSDPRDHQSVGVVLPSASDLVNQEDYEAFPDVRGSPEPASGKRRIRMDDYDEDDLDPAPVQREKADAAFRGLHSYVQSIFEAEDQFETNSILNNELLTTMESSACLTIAAQMKAESLLHKAIHFDCFVSVPLDDLLRLQKSCDPPIKITESLTLNVNPDGTWETSDIEIWLVDLNTAENGLRSARTALRMMTGGREERQIYSEELIIASVHALKNVIEDAIVPIVELRTSSTLFRQFVSVKKIISSVLNQCRHLLSLVKDLISRIELSESVINTLEDMVSRLLFVENAHTEKESVLGVQKFDPLRVAAMDTLAQIFSIYPAQRHGIFDEILTSLAKLPVTKQSARQFKLIDGGSIQLVSALIMRLVQTSANRPDDDKEKRRLTTEKVLRGEGNAQSEMEADGDYSRKPVDARAIDTERKAVQDPIAAVEDLQAIVTPLLTTAKQSAQYVVSYIVNQAITKKTGEAPYRDLLDLFVQDFITCLSSPDWPASELLLRLFLYQMVRLAEEDKTAAAAKNMALDLLGELGAAISQLNSSVRKSAHTIEATDQDRNLELGKSLLKLVADSLEGRCSNEDLVAWDGPFRISIEILTKRSSDDNGLQSAVGFRVADWASQVTIHPNLDLEDPDNDQILEDSGRLAYRLRLMITDKKWYHRESSFNVISSGHARLAHSLIIMNSEFCKHFERVLTILLGSMISDQATVRSKSLKSVNQVLETDPTILDRGDGVIRLITKCSRDTSVQVRDSALGLIGKCIGLKPALEDQLVPEILQRVSDSGIGVRKRAIKLLKDIYLRNENEDIRTSVAEVFLHRVNDLDGGVQELARQTIEDIWIVPLYLPASADDDTIQYRLRVTSQVKLMAQTVKRNAGVSPVLDKVLRNVLAKDARNSTANRRVCKTLVTVMFDSIVENSTATGDGRLEARDALQLLMVFAKADAELFSVDQVQLLQPYTADLKTEEDLVVFRAVVVIFRHVFPYLSSAHSNFLVAVRQTLMSCVHKLARSLTDDVVACLWIISEALGSKDHLARLALSALDAIRKMRSIDLSTDANSAALRKLSKYALLVGLIGKHCDLDSQDTLFRQKFPAWKADSNGKFSVAKLMVDTIIPFASPEQPMEGRKAALDAVGMICQSWPKNFSSANVYTAFQHVFDEKEQALESMILRSLNDFMMLEEKRSEPDVENAVGSGVEIKATLGVMGGTQHDGVALEIAHKFLKDITRIALASQDEHAVLATQILTSINRQGMNHPKECGPALVALETSQNPTIASMAHKEHEALHQKHETIMEKEYMRAIQAAYIYQRDVVKDTRGVWKETNTAKLALLFDVLKISKPKGRKRFYESLCSRIDFDPTKLEATAGQPDHVLFSQFVTENLAFAEYHSTDDVLVTVAAMEKIVAGTGAAVAHAIETEVFNIRMVDKFSPINEQLPPAIEGIIQLTDDKPQVTPALEKVAPARLRQLTASSIILSSLWEARTYLRRLYGLSSKQRDPKSKGASKDTNKAPLRVQSVSSDKIWSDLNRVASSLSTEETMIEQCKQFVELLTVDKDFKIAAEGEDEAAARMRLTTPSDDEGDLVTPGSRGRGKKSAGTPNSKGKKRARSSSVSRRTKKTKRESAGSNDEDEGTLWG